MVFYHFLCSLIGLYCQVGVIKLDIDYMSLINNNISYLDNSFPPNDSSLIGYDNNIVQNTDLNILFFKEITWKRPSDIFWMEFKLFKTIEPSIIEQGIIGDCYFLAALSSLSKYPKHIKKLFLQNSTNLAGVYVIILYDATVSSWREILVDDYLPAKKSMFIYDFAFTKTSDRSIWPHLIEKAFAKLKGSYLKIIGGYPANALKTLTGSKVTSHCHKNYMSDYNNSESESMLLFFKVLKNAINSGYILCSSTHLKQHYNSSTLYGIVPSHAYSIIDVLYFHDDHNNPVRLVKLRNPHGSNEWEGDWSDRSEKWSSERLKIEGKFHGDRIDGIFFMELKEFLRYFYCTDICEFKENN